MKEGVERYVNFILLVIKKNEAKDEQKRHSRNEHCPTQCQQG